MKEFIKKNTIIAAIVLAGAIMALNAALIFYNKTGMVKNNAVKHQTESVKSDVEKLVGFILHNIDLGVRAYGLTKKQEMLNPTQLALKEIDPLFDNMETQLLAQQYDIPESGLEGLRKTFHEYANFSMQMVAMADRDSMATFKSMMAEDRGLKVYLTWLDVCKKIIDYENNLNATAVAEYEWAMNSNVWLQFLMLLIGLPTLGFIVYKLKNDDIKSQSLLIRLAENNRKYVFDSGKSVQTDDPEQVIESSIENLQRASEYIENIATGNYSAQWEELNENNRKLNETNLAGRLTKNE